MMEADKHNVLPDSNLLGFENALTFSPDGTILVGAGMKRRNILIKLWNVDTGKSLGTLSGHTEPIKTLVFSHDGKILASGSQDGTILSWNWDKIIAKRTSDNEEN